MKYLFKNKFLLSSSILSLAFIFVIVSIVSNNIINNANDLQPVKSVKHKVLKKDRPDLFIKYMHDIKTKFGETKPGYSTNYKIKELLKATNLTSTNGLSKLAKTNALNWTERGPGNVSGRTRAIVVDPDDATHSTWFVGSASGGVWKTANAGASWNILTENLSNLTSNTLVMAASNHNIMYLGTGEGFGNVDQIQGSGIWKTTDKGVTWTQLANTANDEFQNVTRLVVDPNNENIVVASTSVGHNGTSGTSGIWKTIDGGNSWNRVYTSNSTVEDLIANPLNFNTLYASENSSGVIKSIDAGNTWFNSANGIVGVARMEIAMGNTDTSKIYASTELSNPDGTALYVSGDAGANWIKANDPLGNKDWLGGQGWYDNAIAVDPYSDTTVYVAGTNMFKLDVSNNSIITTTVITDAYNDFGGPNSQSDVHPDHHNITLVKTDVANNKFRLIVGNDGGVTYSDDKGVTFIKTLNGYNTTQFYGLDKAPGTERYIGGTQDNGSYVSPPSPNSASVWVSAPSGDGFEAAWNFSNSLQLLESSQNNGIGRSVDGGISWSFIPDALIPTGQGNAPFITKIASSKLSPNLVFIVGALNGVSGVSRSTDFGATWTGVAVPSAAWSNSSDASHVRISLTNPLIVWAANTLITGNTFSVSVDSGKTFTETQSSNLAPNASISGFTTDPVDQNTAYALFSIAQSPKILKTTNLGLTWTELSGFGTGTVSTNGFPDVGVFCLLVMPNNANIIWAGTEIGIFESRDAGSTWKFANNGLPAVAVWQMRAFDGQVIVATHGRGVWTVPLIEVVTGIKTITSVLPENYSLEQNFPNPFNPTTQIRFTLPFKSSVNLIVYNALGRKVSELVNQELPAGIQTVTWNGLNSSGVRASSGVYFYQIKAGNFNQVKKMLLLK